MASCSRKIAATASSISEVVTPGTAIRRTWSSALATTRPASRIRAISRGLFSLITAAGFSGGSAAGDLMVIQRLLTRPV